MPKYYVQQKLLSSNSRTLIKSETGTPLFLLVGKWGDRGDVLSIYSMKGDLLASIKQTSLALRPKFELYEYHKKVGTLQHLLSINRDFYYIHQLRWAVVGNIKEHHYSIFKLNSRIMTMDKSFLTEGDFFILDVVHKEHAPLCICISAILDYWVLKREASKERLTFKRHQLSWSWDY